MGLHIIVFRADVNLPQRPPSLVFHLGVKAKEATRCSCVQLLPTILSSPSVDDIVPGRLSCLLGFQLLIRDAQSRSEVHDNGRPFFAFPPGGPTPSKPRYRPLLFRVTADFVRHILSNVQL